MKDPTFTEMTFESASGSPSDTPRRPSSSSRGQTVRNELDEQVRYGLARHFRRFGRLFLQSDELALHPLQLRHVHSSSGKHELHLV